MGTLDSNGVYIYDTTDAVSPLHTLLNVGQQSVSDALGEVNGPKTRYWRYNRAAGPDAPFVTANTVVVSGTITDAPAGKYMVNARVVLYAAGSAADGEAFVRAGATTELARYAIPGTALPQSVEISFAYTHGGGNLLIAGGYNRVAGTPTVISSGTSVFAYYLGA